MLNYLNTKIERLLVSRKIMKLFYYFHFINGGYNSKKIDLFFANKKSRVEITQKILKTKSYKSYLEIGTFKDDLFKEINCETKVGVDPKSGGM